MMVQTKSYVECTKVLFATLCNVCNIIQRKHYSLKERFINAKKVLNLIQRLINEKKVIKSLTAFHRLP